MRLKSTDKYKDCKAAASTNHFLYRYIKYYAILFEQVSVTSARRVFSGSLPSRGAEMQPSLWSEGRRRLYKPDPATMTSR